MDGMARSRISNIARGTFPPSLASLLRPFGRASSLPPSKRTFLFISPRDAADCLGPEMPKGGGPQVATNDSLTRIHRPRPPHNSRSAWRTAAAAGQQPARFWRRHQGSGIAGQAGSPVQSAATGSTRSRQRCDARSSLELKTVSVRN